MVAHHPGETKPNQILNPYGSMPSTPLRILMCLQGLRRILWEKQWGLVHERSLLLQDDAAVLAVFLPPGLPPSSGSEHPTPPSLGRPFSHETMTSENTARHQGCLKQNIRPLNF